MFVNIFIAISAFYTQLNNSSHSSPYSIPANTPKQLGGKLPNQK